MKRQVQTLQHVGILLAFGGLLCPALASAAQSRIAIQSPAGGELFVDGQQQVVRVAARLKLMVVELSRDGGATFELLGKIDATAKDLESRTALKWTVTLPASSTCQIRVSSGAFQATSGMFSIAPRNTASQPPLNGETPGVNTVSTATLVDGSVTTAKLADGAVTTPKLADNAVSSQKIGSGQASQSFVLTADGSGGSYWQPVSGAGSTPGGSAGGDLAGTYPNPQLAANAVTTAKLADGTVTAAKLAANAVDLTGPAITGVLPVAQGGTGQATAANAFNALAPSQTGNGGKFLKTDGATTSWASAVVSPSGADQQVQFNDAGEFGADASFSYDKLAHALTLSGTGGPSLIVNGAPAASGGSSLLQLGAAIANGSSNGTYFGLSAANGYTGNLADLQTNGTSMFALDASGNASLRGTLSLLTANDTITCPTGLTLEETGDTFGTVRLRLQNRAGVNGAMFEQAGSEDLVDFVFKTPNTQSNIRLENRAGSTFVAQPEFQFGTPGDPTFIVSDLISCFRKGSLGINVAAPAEVLDLNGRMHLAQGTAPGTTTDRLYNVGGNLFWNGVNLDGSLSHAAYTNQANTFTTGTQTIQTGGDNTVGLQVKGNSGTQAADLQQWLDSGGGVRAAIHNDGSVTIGGSTQLGRFTLEDNVQGGDAAPLALYNGGGMGGAATMIDFYDYYPNQVGQPQVRIKAVDNADFSANLIFYTKDPGAGTNTINERMRITSSGDMRVTTTDGVVTLQDIQGAFYEGDSGLYFDYPGMGKAAVFTEYGASSVAMAINSPELMPSRDTNRSGGVLRMNSTDTLSGGNADEILGHALSLKRYPRGTNNAVEDFQINLDTGDTYIAPNGGKVGVGTNNPGDLFSVLLPSQGTIASFTDSLGSNVKMVTDAGGRSSVITSGTQVNGQTGGAYFTALGYEETWTNYFTATNTAGEKLMRVGNLNNKFSIQRLSDDFTSIQSTPFTLNNDAPSDSFVMNSSGQIGLGTNNPGKTLEFGGTDATLYFNSLNSNLLKFNGEGIAPPTSGSRDVGSKIVLYPQADGGADGDYAIGIDNFTEWFQVPVATGQYSFKYFAGTTEVLRVQGDGMLGVGAPAAATNVRLALKDGHLQIQQSGATSAAAENNAGTSASASVSNATDVAGNVALTTGTASYAAGAQVTVTFAKTFNVAPIVTLTPTNANAASAVTSRQVYVTPTTTGSRLTS